MAKRGRKCFSVGQIIKSQWFKPWTHGRRSIEKWSFRTRKSVPWNWLGCEIGELKTPAKIVPCFFRGKNFTENEPCSGDVSIVQYSFDACSSDVLMSWTTLGFFNQSTASGKKSTSFHVFFSKSRGNSMHFFNLSCCDMSIISKLPTNQWSSSDLCNDRSKWLVHTTFCKCSKYLPPIGLSRIGGTKKKNTSIQVGETPRFSPEL